MLQVEALSAGYGSALVLFDLTFELKQGEILGLLGRNGMGKTTTILSLFGLTRHRGGAIRLNGRSIVGLASHVVAGLGIGLVPEGRQIFPNLTVEENLLAAARAGTWTLARVFGLFPRLEERRRHAGIHLSGGEQQMLAIGRALMTNPRLLILDEATQGLAPAIGAEIWRCLRQLKAEGQSILLVDSHLGRMLQITDRSVILEKGCIVWQGISAELDEKKAIAERYLAV